jgi:hypothetical protein
MAIIPTDLVTMDTFLRTGPNAAIYISHFTRITKIVNDRRSGWKPTIEEYIEGMIRAMLTNSTSWAKIAPHYKSGKIASIFKSYNLALLKTTSPSILVKDLLAIKCGNRNIYKQMDSLKDNIETLEKIMSTFSSAGEPFEAYFKSISPTYPILNVSDLDEFTRPKGKYKLQQMGVPLVCEFLKNMGFELPKPDVHLKTFLSSSRMGKSKKPLEATNEEVFKQIQNLAKSSTFTIPQIDLIIWSFCADGFGKICTSKTPKCATCPVRASCAYPTFSATPATAATPTTTTATPAAPATATAATPTTTTATPAVPATTTTK